MIDIADSASNVTIQTKAELDIYSKDKLFNAITKATALMLQSGNFEENMDRSLAIIGKAAKIDRINIFEICFDSENERTLLSQLHQWTKCSVNRQIESPDLNLVFYDTTSSNWLNKLKKGKIFRGSSRDLTGLEKNFYGTNEIKSFLSVPIFLGKKLWGYVVFDDCTNLRKWSSDEERLLFGLAGTIGSVYLRKEGQEELMKAKAKAEESDRLKSAFLSNMSHEFRTPMNNIIGFISLLQESDLKNEIKDEYIRIVKKNGERLLNTIYEIIDISEIESGQISVSFDDINLIEFIENLYNAFKPEVEAKGLLFKQVFHIAEEQSIIKTDKIKLYSVLTNLLRNAVKYTDNGFVELGCSVEKNSLQFYVKDSGIGIPENKQQAIFERFMQADISRSRSYEGSGLGLSISKAYIEMLGGKIWVESKKILVVLSFSKYRLHML